MLKHSPNPEFCCYCGKPALYRYGVQGFCKGHRREAVVLVTRNNDIRVARSAASYDSLDLDAKAQLGRSKHIHFKHRRPGE